MPPDANVLPSGLKATEWIHSRTLKLRNSFPDEACQSLMELSWPPEAINFPSGLKASPPETPRNPTKAAPEVSSGADANWRWRPDSNRHMTDLQSVTSSPQTLVSRRWWSFQKKHYCPAYWRLLATAA